MKFQQTVEKSAEIGEGINYDKILDLLISISTNLAMAVAILVIGFWIVKKVMKLLTKSLSRANLSPEITSFLSSLFSGSIAAICNESRTSVVESHCRVFASGKRVV